MNLKISLIIPAFNEEKYIGNCLKMAIENSGGKFFEIIVVDNASSDNTEDVAKNFEGVKVISEPEKGLTKARQRGFLEAGGDLLAYIDADTQMLKGWIETVIKEFGENENLACLSGPYTYYDASTTRNFFVKIYWRFAKLLYWLAGYMAVGGNFVIKKEVVEKMNGFDTSIAFYGEDTDVARRASKFGKVKFTLKLLMPTSGRRFSGQGFFYTAVIYVKNFFSEVFWGKPATEEYKDIR